jgi:UDP-N-acetylmuramoyl-L-alanyl-D-glutamate--2,6-diaminopimelate ligase
MAEYVKAGVQYVVMEVSSQGLDQGRVVGIEFDYAIFTNLTRDHLDYHQTMGSYAAAKRRLFEFPSLKGLIISQDDRFGRALIEEYKIKLPVQRE